VSNDWVVRHHNRYLQLQPTRHQRRSPRVKAVLLESEQGAIEVCYGGESMALTELSGPPPRASEGEQETTVLLTTPPRQPGGPVRGAGNQRSAGRRSGQARRCLPSSSMHALRPSMPLLPLSSDAHRATRRGFGWPPGSSHAYSELLSRQRLNLSGSGWPIPSTRQLAASVSLCRRLPRPGRGGKSRPRRTEGALKLSTVNCVDC
jgi:hypothetical protein